MKLSNKITGLILALIVVLSLGVSTLFMLQKQGYHEDELLTYNLANSSKQLEMGEWSDVGDFTEYLAATEGHRFDYAQVVQNQIIDASHPPFYYALVHTVCSLFPGVFNRWLAYVINLVMMAISLLLLFRVGKRVTNNNLYALIAVGGYAFSIACVTTTVYLRMYATLTCFVLAFLALTLRIYDRGKKVKLTDMLMLLPAVTLGVLTQYYFILFAGLIGLVFLILSIRERCVKRLLIYAAVAIAGAGIALAIYPHIISNVLGGNRGLGSLEISVDAITIFTYVVYKLGTYMQLLAKDLFLNQVWFLALCTGLSLGAWVYFRFVRKEKMPRRGLFIFVPAVVYFFFIALVSPFNSDRYVMARHALLPLRQDQSL